MIYPELRRYIYLVYHPETGAKQSLDLSLKENDHTIWTKSLSNEFGRLTQGIGKTRAPANKIEDTNKIVFVKRNKIPTTAKITYVSFVCDIKTKMKETHRIRIAVGSDRLDYHADPSAPTVGLLNTKIHLNSNIFDAKYGARYCVADITN